METKHNGVLAIEISCWAFFIACAIVEVRWLVLFAVAKLRLDTPDWGTWIGAIGTVCTLIGTIWLATSETRRRHREEHAVAVIVAARLIAPLRSTLDILTKQIAHFSDGAQTGYGINCEQSASALKGASPWSDQDLLRLVLLPNQAAAHLAAARSLIDMIIGYLGLMAKLDTTTEEGRTYIRAILAALADAKSQVTVGLTQCEAILSKIR